MRVHTRTSQEITHPSTTLVQARLTADEGKGGEAARRRIFTGVSGGRFPCISYGIATLTAGSLEFQDFIPGP
uniref:Uncharacterized protein n=1 Tax=Salix viminalis TaxID=40686 RepID=A0A6N2LAD3_SALVM